MMESCRLHGSVHFLSGKRQVRSKLLRLKKQLYKSELFLSSLMLELNVISARCAEDLGFFKQGAVVVVD